MSNSTWRGQIRRSSDINIIDPTLRRSSTRRAKIAFTVTLLAGWAIAALVAWQLTAPALAVIVGLVVAFAAAFCVGVLVWIWPVVRIIWHWSLELMVFAGLMTGLAALSAVVPVAQAGGILACGIGGLFVFPPLRRQVTAFSWCVISRHRLRMSFAGYLRGNREGTLPLMLWARPTPVGERVWVWLRPGLSLGELEQRGDQLAVSCWARAVTVTSASSKYAGLLRFDIKRRDTFTDTIESPLAGLASGSEHTPTMGEPVEPTALDLPDVPTPTPEPDISTGTPRSDKRRSKRSKPSGTDVAVVDPAAEFAEHDGDDDISDWL